MRLYMAAPPQSGQVVFAIEQVEYETYREAGWTEATEEQVATWPHIGESDPAPDAPAPAEPEAQA